MKVAMVVPGGVDRSGTHRVVPFVLALVERVAHVHDLHVFALAQEPEPATWPLLGATVHNAGTRRPRLRAFRDLLAEHRRGAFDVIHAVWARAGMVACAAGTLLRRPVLLHLVGGDVASVPGIGYGMLATARGRFWLRTLTRMADRVAVESLRSRELARTATAAAIEHLPLGVAVDRWPLREPIPRPGDRPARLLFVASLNHVKDPWTLLRAMAALRDRGVPFTLDVLGEDLLDGEIQRLAGELRLDEVVRFHGWVPHHQLRPWMEAADLLLVTSRHEGAPLVAMEAALAGVPVAGTEVGHLAGWAPDAAVVVPRQDPDALAAAVEALLRDESRRLQLAHAAQRIALGHNADHGAARVMQIYDEMVLQRRRR